MESHEIQHIIFRLVFLRKIHKLFPLIEIDHTLQCT